MARRSEWGEPRRPMRGLAPRPRILIVCEGEQTEPVYFGRWRQLLRNEMVIVDIVSGGADPKTLVERAAERKKAAEDLAERLRNDFERYDQVWCVFDRDQHVRFDEAIQQAQANGIRLAVSNPCFELWLLLHYRDQRAHIERRELCRVFRGYHARYEKNPPVEDLMPRYGEAVRRAEALDRWQRSQRCPGRNPHTGVYLLTERLREFDREHLLRRHNR